MKNHLQLLILALSLLFLLGCVKLTPVEKQAPSVNYKPTDKILISVIDQRKRVKNGKSESFIGRSHGLFGIPSDWNLSKIARHESDEDIEHLDQFIQSRLITGLKQSHWNVDGLDLSKKPSYTKADALMKNAEANKLFVLLLDEWAFSLNLNLVSAFNFDTEVVVIVYEYEKRDALIKRIRDHDEIDEKAFDSYQNRILFAYRTQLIEILNNHQVKKALM